ncbi:MAG: SOS response-associated peptidase [Campylobacterota bacterium]|nr:SOS response-associated peptidase [Campylobacterota bacterium]
MPGRLAIFDDSDFRKDIKDIYSYIKNKVGVISPKYNIAPTTYIPILLDTKVYSYGHFGLIPSWARDNKSININARCETLFEKKSFRESFKSKRCLIPINGWYEWKKDGELKTPHFIKPSKSNSFVCAGLYDHWYDNKSGKTILSVALITTQPNSVVESIHDRMPVILDKKDYKIWLDKNSTLEELNKLFKLYPDENIVIDEVSTFVNKVSNDTIECLSKNIKKEHIQTTLF